jgi:hypothetical protein
LRKKVIPPFQRRPPEGAVIGLRHSRRPRGSSPERPAYKTPRSVMPLLPWMPRQRAEVARDYVH